MSEAEGDEARGDGAEGRHGLRTPTNPMRVLPAPRKTGKARMEAFSDGVLAVAGTLLVIELAIPRTSGSSHDLLGAILSEWPGYLGYLVSFTTVAVLWLGHNTITNALDHADAALLRINMLLLFLVCLLPFVTRLMSDFMNRQGAERLASLIYGLILMACSAVLGWLWRYSVRARLLLPELDDHEIRMLTERLTPSLLAYVVVIVVGFFLPTTAIFGYLLIAVFMLTPMRLRRRGRPIDPRKRRAARHQKAEERPASGA